MSLRRDELVNAQQRALHEVVSLLAVDMSTAFHLLRFYQWMVSDAVEEWFQNEEKIRAKIGLHDASGTENDLDDGGGDASTSTSTSFIMGTDIDTGEQQQPGSGNEMDVRREETGGEGIAAEGNNDKEEAGGDTDTTTTNAYKCGICLDVLPRHVMIASPSCGSGKHLFCTDCYRQYIVQSVNEGAGCLALRCPMPDCKRVLPVELVRQLCSGQNDNNMSLNRYDRFFIDSFVNDDRRGNIKWCPAAGCQRAIKVTPAWCIAADADGASAEDKQVWCDCGKAFCWQCGMEAHSPVDCKTVKNWILKNSSESENMNWIIANSKPCPKCLRPIEKNQGCMHMTCAICRHEFCWLCLGDWAEHGNRTGGFYNCNRYDEQKKNAQFTAAERKRDQATSSLHRYLHYYERWAAHEKARAKAEQQHDHVREAVLLELCERTQTPLSQLKFITEALKQVVECRRMLKWTYAYGFFLDDSEWARRNFFEFQQGEAEASLERLHEETETKLSDFITVDTGGSAAATTRSKENTSKKKASTSSGGGAATGVAPANRDDERSFDAEKFDEFRCRLTSLTQVTRDYFSKLVAELASGNALSQVSPVHAAMSRSAGASR